MSRKRLTKEQQTDLLAERLNDALDELIAQACISVAGADQDLQRQAIQAKLRLDAIKAMPALAERLAKLLGLDAPEQKPSEVDGANKPGSLAELEQKLALVRASGLGKVS